MTQKQPIRVLHFLNEWVSSSGLLQLFINIVRESDPDIFLFDVIVPKNSIDYDIYADVRKVKKIRLIPLEYGPRHFLFARSFQAIVEEFGPYNIIHANGHHICGHVLRQAAFKEIAIRVSHAENDLRQYYKDANPIMKIYYSLTKYWLRKYTSHGIATSEASACSLYGENWKVDSRWEITIIPNGIDLDNFYENNNSRAMRDELGVPHNAFVIGHVGRLHYQKNHEFLLQIFAKVHRQNQHALLLLVGDGPEQFKLTELVNQLELQEAVMFLGSRQDVADILQGVIDVFVFPSRFEGLPLAMVEAQAAALPCIYSDVITDKACVVKPLLTPLSIQQSPEIWAEQILKLMRHKPVTKKFALSQIEEAGLTKTTFAKTILQTYNSLIENNAN